MSQADESRLRTHPEERFAPAERLLDLQTIARELQQERAATQGAHRQRTIYKHGALTVAMFLFDAGGAIRQHIANGPVLIQVLEGSLQVQTPGKTHELSAGQLLILASKVPHDVQARSAARMLLTVHLETNA